MTLIPEDGTGLSTANSYCSLAEANAYHDGRGFVATWTNATVASKTTALLWATRLLDEQYCWSGSPVLSTQALGWPRYSAYDRHGYAVASTIVPTAVKDATAELARQLLDNDRVAQADDGQPSSVSLGSASVTYATGAKGADVVPAGVYRMIRPYLNLTRTVMRA
jgi:hypothetical protein